jgi:hypothetical protein
MDYTKKDILPEGGVSEVREPVATYAAGGRVAVEPWAGSRADRAGGEVVRDAEWTRERKKEWEQICVWGREILAEWGVTTEEECMAIINEEIRQVREEEKLRKNK